MCIVPWDVINHVDLLRAKPDARPQAFWINTSGNDMVKRFVDKAEDKTTQQEIERLIDGEAITKAVQLELTYDEVDRSHRQPVERAVHDRVSHAIRALRRTGGTSW